MAANESLLAILATDDPFIDDDPIEARWWPVVEDQLRLAPNPRRMGEYLLQLWADLGTGKAGTAGDMTVIWSDPQDELRFLAGLHIARTQLADAFAKFPSGRRRRFQIYRLHNDEQTVFGHAYDNRLDAETELARDLAGDRPAGTTYELRQV
jgi:hypothetical protein